MQTRIVKIDPENKEVYNLGIIYIDDNTVSMSHANKINLLPLLRLGTL